MYQAKTPKKEEEDKNKYTLFYCHPEVTRYVNSVRQSHPNFNPQDPTFADLHIRASSQKWTQPYYMVVSIDPATDNFSFRIERRWKKSINPNDPKHLTLEGKSAIPGQIETIELVKVKFNKLTDDMCVTPLYAEITSFLDQYKKWYNDTCIFLIERQMAINYKATRVSQHVISYYLSLLSSSSSYSVLLEISPKMKGKMLGAPKGLSKTQLKEWGVAIAINYLMARCDARGYQLLHIHNKKDDMADTIIQIEALFVILGFDLTVDIRITVVVTQPQPRPSQPLQPIAYIGGPQPQPTFKIVEDDSRCEASSIRVPGTHPGCADVPHFVILD
jgi:hypothetical protein